MMGLRPQQRHQAGTSSQEAQPQLSASIQRSYKSSTRASSTSTSASAASSSNQGGGRRVTMGRIRQTVGNVNPLNQIKDNNNNNKGQHNNNENCHHTHNGGGGKRKNCPQCSDMVVHKELRTVEEAKELYLKHQDLLDQVMELHSDIPYLVSTSSSTPTANPASAAVTQFLGYAQRYGPSLKTYQDKVMLKDNNKNSSSNAILCHHEKAIPLTSEMALKDCRLTLQKPSSSSSPETKASSGRITGNATLLGNLNSSKQNHGSPVLVCARVHVTYLHDNTWSLAGRLVSDWRLPGLPVQQPQGHPYSLKDANVDVQLDSQTKEWIVSLTDHLTLGGGSGSSSSDLLFPNNTLSLLCSSATGGYRNASIQITIDDIAVGATGLDWVERTVRDFALAHHRLLEKKIWYKDLTKVLSLPLASATMFLHPTTGESVTELELIGARKQRVRTYFLNLKKLNQNKDNNNKQQDYALILGSDKDKYISSTDAEVTMNWGPLKGHSLELVKGMHFPNYESAK